MLAFFSTTSSDNIKVPIPNTSDVGARHHEVSAALVMCFSVVICVAAGALLPDLDARSTTSDMSFEVTSQSARPIVQHSTSIYSI